VSLISPSFAFTKPGPASSNWFSSGGMLSAAVSLLSMKEILRVDYDRILMKMQVFMLRKNVLLRLY
jgi:hypothetical protein